MCASTTILITGGAGFIGSHLADKLLRAGCRVRVFDALHPQVHQAGKPPAYLDPEVELQIGDVRDRIAFKRALKGVDQVVHFAARVGVGQSMYEIGGYSDTNVMGTANLLSLLRDEPVERLLVASSMSVYGEGFYVDHHGEHVYPQGRDEIAMRSGVWDFLGDDGRPLRPLPTPEAAHCVPSSIYALGKYDQERMCLIAGEAYRFPVTALRFFNCYGSRQALSNPYTGVLAIFAARLLNGQPPLIFEDGRQQRDFVHVDDVTEACVLALKSPAAAGRSFNVGRGEPQTIREVAALLGRVLERRSIEPRITGNFRVGDVRHCFADTRAAQSVFGFRARIGLEAGLAGMVEWLEEQTAHDHTDDAQRELASWGLQR